MDEKLAALIKRLYGLGGQYVRDALPGGSLNPEVKQLSGLLAVQAEATAKAIREKGKAFKRGLDDPQKYAGEALAAGLDMLGMAPLGLTVWHGSPHKFTKFDMSKIGTGEGAQAYGHGLYFAENPEVAKTYQKQVSSDGFLVGGKVFDLWQLSHLNIRSMIARGDLDGAITKAKKIAVSDSPVADKAAHDLKILEEIKAKGGLKENQGVLYKVDIPDEAVARFLDWDKPLNQQALEVQKALEFAKQRYGFSTSDLGSFIAKQGARTDAERSKLLQSMGIPGIRYLDQGSRSSGQGSSNFVLFDDKMARILERNGEATGLKQWSPNEWDGLTYRDPFTK